MRTPTGAIAILVGTATIAGCSRRDEPASATAAPTASEAAAAAAARAPDASTPSSFPVPKASVDFVLNPQGLPAYDGPTGSVEGTVRVTGPAAPSVAVDAKQCPAALDTYGKLFREGPALADGSRPVADAAVVVVGYEGHFVPDPREAKRVTIGANCAYSSRTITMTFGQRLEVANESKLLFGPVIDNSGMVAVMVAPPQGGGEPVKLYPRKAGYFTLSDHMAPFVHEDLYVFRHPLHTVTGLDGYYRIDGIPIGDLKVGVHHPGVGADAEAAVTIRAGVVTKVDLLLTYAPKAARRPTDAGVLPARLRND